MRSVQFVNWVLRGFFRLICHVDRAELAQVPMKGPLILVANHINSLEAPVLLPNLAPRPVTGIAKSENWKNPLFNFLFKQWEIIPIDRGVVDRDAFRLSVDALNQGKILAVFPEGTRSKTGAMQQGKAGVLALALRSGAPLLPMGLYGYENFWSNLKHLRRTDFHMRVGRPFRLEKGGEALSRDARQVATDEIMYKIAELLPERYRGYYQGVEQVQYQYVKDL